MYRAVDHYDHMISGRGKSVAYYPDQKRINAISNSGKDWIAPIEFDMRRVERCCNKDRFYDGNLVTAPDIIVSSRRPAVSHSYRFVLGNGGNQDSRLTTQLS